ncbi:MAG: ABC transporter substrate-binding protein [Pseudobdellovibrio sp.]
MVITCQQKIMELFRVKLLIALMIMFFSYSAYAKNKKEITINIDAPIIKIDPSDINDSNASWVILNVGRRLVENNLDGETIGSLAKSWTVDNLKKNWTFQINPNYYFTDGSKVTTHDIVESLNKTILNKQNNRLKHYLQFMDSAKYLAEDKVQITLKKPLINFLQIIADAGFTIHKKCMNNYKICFTKENLELISLSEKSIIIKNNLNEQIIRILPLSMDNAISMFRNQELDVLHNYGLEGLEYIKSLTSNTTVTVPHERTYYIAFNDKSSKFSKKREISKNCIDNFKTDTLADYLKDINIEFNESLLSSILTPLNFHQTKIKNTKNNKCPYPLNAISIKSYNIGKWINMVFDKNKVNHLSYDKKEYLEQIKNNNYDISINGYGITIRDIEYLATLFYSKSNHNYARVSDANIDKLIEGALTAHSRNEKNLIFKKILEINENEGYYKGMFHTPLIYILQNKIVFEGKNKSQTLMSPFLNIQKISRQD